MVKSKERGRKAFSLDPLFMLISHLLLTPFHWPFFLVPGLSIWSRAGPCVYFSLSCKMWPKSSLKSTRTFFGHCKVRKKAGRFTDDSGVRRSKVQVDGLFGNELHISNPRSQIFVPWDQSTKQDTRTAAQGKGLLQDLEEGGRRHAQRHQDPCDQKQRHFSREKSVHLNTNGS